MTSDSVLASNAAQRIANFADRREVPKDNSDIANAKRVAPRARGYHNIRFATHHAIRQLLGR